MGKAMAWLLLVAMTIGFIVTMGSHWLIARNEGRQQAAATPTKEWIRCVEMFPPCDDAADLTDVPAPALRNPSAGADAGSDVASLIH